MTVSTRVWRCTWTLRTVPAPSVWAESGQVCWIIGTHEARAPKSASTSHSRSGVASISRDRSIRIMSCSSGGVSPRASTSHRRSGRFGRRGARRHGR